MLTGFGFQISNFFRKANQILVASGKSFLIDDNYTKASALTFYTLQSIVPFLAFLLGIAKGFGLDEYLKNLVTKAFQEQEEVTTYAIQIAYATLQHIREGVVVGIGVVFLVWAIINLLGYIEIFLNQIWKIRTERTFLRKINDYIAILVICPIIFIVSSSLTVYLKTELIHLSDQPGFHEVASFLLLFFKLVPWVLSWLLFFLLYFLMPNAKLRIWPRVIAAILAGSAFQLWQILYIYLQVEIFSYSTIYGAFAALPLFFIWLQVSWLIALGGAEIAANMENIIFTHEKPLVQNQEKINRKQLCLLILYLCEERFYTALTPFTENEIAKKLQIPLDITRKMLAILTDGEILTEVRLKHGNIGFHPLFDPKCFTLKQVMDVLEKSSDFELIIPTSKPLKKISEFLKKIELSRETSEGNITLNQLFTKEDAILELPETLG